MTLRPYWSYRDELAVEDGHFERRPCSHSLEPPSRDIDEITRITSGDRENPLARTCVYWNGINRDIEEVARKCATRLEMQRAQPHEPLMPHETPTCAWQLVGADLFVINKGSYLIESDYYSKFPFVYSIPTAVTSKIKSLFAEQGVPRRVVSDNGGHFSSGAFRKFADQWCFDHVTSSPHYPQSNGHSDTSKP